MLKNAYLLEKTVKIAKRREIPPRTSFCLQRLGIPYPDPALLLPPSTTILSSSYLALIAFCITIEKEQNN